MAKVKLANPSYFSEMHKTLTTSVELIRAKQDEKQAILDQFNAESRRFFFGKISERALMASVKKTNNELQRLDNIIRTTIVRAKKLSDKEREHISKQVPILYKATISGVTGGQKKVKKTKRKIKKKVSRAKKKSVNKKRKVVRKKR